MPKSSSSSRCPRLWLQLCSAAIIGTSTDFTRSGSPTRRKCRRSWVWVSCGPSESSILFGTGEIILKSPAQVITGTVSDMSPPNLLVSSSSPSFYSSSSAASL
ncbi:unnamed protein product [Cuscuta europaea]|uniref:Uncharacterized protein n=1 Tax=Cuscuta europaea TaxID=41803 RepID=A0A9P0YYP4_CUSEU|nr:unnamed protein product [Cuscuta europaea]